MTRFRKVVGKTLATLGVAGLAVAGAAGVAMAEPWNPELGNITGDSGSLTIHKHEGSAIGNSQEHRGQELTGDDVPSGDTLEGVEFTIVRIGTDDGTVCEAIDLTTNEGWDLANQIVDGNLPAGTTECQVSGTTVVDTTDGDGKLTFGNLPYGLYYVTETDPGDNDIVSPAIPFYVSIPYPSDQGTWTYDVHVYPKNKIDTTTIEKELEDPGAAIAPGDTLNFTVNTTVGAVGTGQAYNKFVITDTLDSRLSIAVADVTVTATGLTSALAAADYTVAVTGQTVTVTFTPAGLSKLQENAVVTVELAALVDVDLEGAGVIENEAMVNVNDVETDSNKVEVYYGEILLQKLNQAQDVLANAKFELYDAKEGNKLQGPETTDSEGKILFDSVWTGVTANACTTYWLKEVQAPAGYVTPTGDAAWTPVEVCGNQEAAVTVTVTNTKEEGPDLPLTGASGTLLMTIGGLGLMAVAGGAYMVTRRKASHQ